MSNAVFFGVTFLIFFSLLIGFFEIPSGHIIDQVKWSSIQPTNINSVPINSEVKLYGTIESSNNTPINHTEQKVKGKWVPISKTFHDFTLNDGTGHIFINFSFVPKVIKYPHETIANNFDWEYFQNGDKISMIGEAKRNQSGNLTFYPHELSPENGDYYSSYDVIITVFFGGMAVMGMIITVITYTLLSRQINLNNHYISINPPNINIITRQPEDFSLNVNWIENKNYRILRSYGKKSGIVFGISLIILILSMIVFVVSSYACCFFSFFIALFIVIFSGAFFAVLWFSSESTVPTHLYFDQDGVYAKYASPKINPYYLQSIRWSDIKNIEHQDDISDSIFWGRPYKIITYQDQECFLPNIPRELGAELLKRYDSFVRGKQFVTPPVAIENPNEYAETTIEKEIPENVNDYRTESYPPKKPYIAPSATKIDLNEYRETTVGKEIPWRVNDYRTKQIWYIVILILIQFLLSPLIFLYINNFGINRGLTLLFLPLIILPGMLIVFILMPSKIAITRDAVYIGKGENVFVYNFSEIDTISSTNRNLKIKYKDGIAKTISYLSVKSAREIFNALESHRISQGIDVSSYTSRSEITWKYNRAYDYYWKLFWIPASSYIIFLGTAIPMYVLIHDSWIQLLLLMLLILLGMFIPFLLYLYVWRPLKLAPRKVGFSQEGLHCEYTVKEFSKILFQWISWKDIANMDLQSESQEYLPSNILSAGDDRHLVQVLTNTGIKYLLGPIDDDIFQELKMHMS